MASLVTSNDRRHAILQAFAKTSAQLQSSFRLQYYFVVAGIFELQRMNLIEIDDGRAVNAHKFLLVQVALEIQK